MGHIAFSDCLFLCADGSKPIAAAASKRPFRLFLFFISLFYCWRCVSEFEILKTGSIGAFRSSTIRFQVLDTRGPGQCPPSACSATGVTCLVPASRSIRGSALRFLSFQSLSRPMATTL